jgi:DedD protein
MDQGLKERLVGAAVLVAIAVWLVPWVLDGPEGEVETAASSLRLPAAEEPMAMRTERLRLGGPEEPGANATSTASTPLAELPRAEPPNSEAQRSAAEETPPPATAATARTDTERTEPVPAARATPPKPSPAAAPTAAAAGDWTVQLGSFGDEANARRLAQRAATFGYKAEVSSYRSDGRTLYRVRVGPHATRSAAEAAASALRVHGVDARVVAAR